ncbi:hypothetical protein CLOM_g19071 [Closterium sp. NIES-68]|nr:hypothetical protein CLOM_g19071 [Closterium sp. NIES-68]GJP66641.1 hypothetical protein CLOP_g23554 [Closterium sp. NIES-67]
MAGSVSGDELAGGKALVPFLQRADELQKHDPLVAYYCRLYAMDKGLKVPGKERSKEVNALLVSIMGRLEKDKAALQLSPDDGLHVEGFAQRVFSKADKQDRAGRADMATAKTFYAAGIFLEVCKQFGDLAPEVEQKQRYAVWKAADIRKALAEGRRPTPGPPGGDADAADSAATGSLSAAPPAASAPSFAPAPPAPLSFPSADSLDATAGTFPFPHASSSDAGYSGPSSHGGAGGSARLQVARPVGSGGGAVPSQAPQAYAPPPHPPPPQADPYAQGSPYSQGPGGYSHAAQGQGSQTAPPPDSAFITSSAPSQPPAPPSSFTSPPTFTHWTPDSHYPSATPPSTAAPSAPSADGWSHPAATASALAYQQPQAAPVGAFSNPIFGMPPAQNAAPGAAPAASATAAGLAGFSFMAGGGAAGSASQGMGGAGGAAGAQPSQISPHSAYGGGGGGVASGGGTVTGGTRVGQNVVVAADGPTASPSVGRFSSSQGPGPREIADAHKAARYAVSALASDDVPTAVDFIRKALALLEPGGGF